MKRLLVLALLLSTPAMAQEVNLPESVEASPARVFRALEIKYYGGITGFDPAGFETLRQVLGAKVADGTLTFFERQGVGYEGGALYCVEVGSISDLDTLSEQLETLTPRDEVTVYRVERRESCREVL